MVKHCEDCRFWGPNIDKKSGECHCRAPLPYKYRPEEKTLHTGTRWPLTDRYQGCGEFVAKE